MLFILHFPRFFLARGIHSTRFITVPATVLLAHDVSLRFPSGHGVLKKKKQKKKERKRKTVSCGIVFLAANQIEEGKRAKETNAGEVGKKTRNKAKREKNEWQRKREGIWKVRQEEGGVLRFSGRSRKKKKERKRFWLARTSLSAGGGQVND